MIDRNNRQMNLEDIVCLIVDDDKFSRTFTKTALYQIGVRNTREASSAADASEIINSMRVDIVLLDHQLPEQSGLALARQIKEGKIDGASQLPVIMVTVDAKEETVMDAKGIGIHEYLVKPISPLALRRRICTALGIREKV